MYHIEEVIIMGYIYKIENNINHKVYIQYAIFLIEKGYTKSKNIDYISHAIREAIKNNKNYLGFKIYL